MRTCVACRLAARAYRVGRAALQKKNNRKDGNNELTAKAGTETATVTLVNRPVNGTLFAGPQQAPYLCESERFELAAGGMLGKPLDADCSTATRVDYLYRSTGGGALKPVPRGARPDLSVDGMIELERLPDVLYVGRPQQGQPDSTISLFKLVDGGSGAVRVVVKLGRTSVSTVEVVQGLAIGDQVVLSDMSAWDAYERVRLN